MSLHEVALSQAQNIEQLREILPDFAKDIRLNLAMVLKEDPESGLSRNQILGIALAAAYATRHPTVIHAMTEEVTAVLSPEEIQAAKAAATIMAMNNVYYRSVHMLKDEEVEKLPPGLRMNVIGSPGIDKTTFELYELAVSAVNGCTGCIRAHARAAGDAGLPKTAVQHVFRIAAVFFATAQAISI